MKVRAVAKDVGISPQKVRLVINMVRGRKVDEALTILSFSPTPTTKAVAKVIKSAVANAESNFQMSPAELRIADIFADNYKNLYNNIIAISHNDADGISSLHIIQNLLYKINLNYDYFIYNRSVSWENYLRGILSNRLKMYSNDASM